jgi:hypothetical protein
MLLINNTEFFGNTSLEMEQLSNPMIITAPDSSFVEYQKCVLVTQGLFVVHVDTASFTNVVGMVIITAWLIYRKKYMEQIAVDLLDFKLCYTCALSQTLH